LELVLLIRERRLRPEEANPVSRFFQGAHFRSSDGAYGIDG